MDRFPGNPSRHAERSLAMQRLPASFCLVLLVLAAFASPAPAEDKLLTMSTTTSTEDSGLLDVLLPALEKDTGIKVKVIAKGTGAALRDGMDGNVDIVFVHAKDKEEKFVAEGYGTKRYAVMHNDFVLAGPPKDPAGVKGLPAAQALAKIAAAQAVFVSRGDDSGTHAKEQELWRASDTALEEAKTKFVAGGKEKEITLVHPKGLGAWYQSIGQGMGKTLLFAMEKQGYTLADRGTYVKQKFGKDAKLDLEILCEGDPALFNPYGVIPVSAKKFPQTKEALATQMAEWLVSAKGQAVIAGFQLEGKRLFFPDAVPGAAK
jgi:tungstate transport system substrate-binding protein